MMIHSRITYFSAILMLSLSFAACSNSTSPDEQDNSDRSEMLNNYGNNIILPAFEEIQTAVKELQVAAQDFENERTLEQLENLQVALKDARIAWQDVSPFQFGPAESILLRSSINTYPVDDNEINDNISSGDYSFGGIDNQDIAGLPTLGYLLHGVGESNEEILAMYTTDAEAENRMTYLLDNITFVKDKIDTATSEWQSSGGDYIGMFLSQENAGTDAGSSLGMLINHYVRHYERFLRDGKIGIPAGVRSAGNPRPKAVEAYYGGYSVELAIANLNQIEQIFAGAGGKGLDDNLVSINNRVDFDTEELTSDIKSQIGDAQSALEQLSDPLSQQIENNNEAVLTSFEELHALVSMLKADMTSALGITITYQDNDGD
ncbi:imelysin family protein [Aliifodinibius salicampi]|uniref:Imelysin family protein n=1 Tax=Fodinibius salicampi TaxID=1920655 RepID=A0ABT3PZB0_9BACT|nr:imelysin family protein [Fodinibius salicampi]MCW9713163.1 imelysin family protein [Fodinibius salicampi]